MEWPRAEYLYTFGFFLMALTGMSIFVIVHRWRLFERLFNRMPIVMVALILLMPCYYLATERNQPRRLHDLYQRLAPFEELIADPQTVFLVSQYAGELPNYVVPDVVKLRSRTLDYSIFGNRPATMPLETFLETQGVNLFYIDNFLWSTFEKNPLNQRLLNSPTSVGWQPLALQDTADRWMLIQKRLSLFEDPEALRKQNANPDIGPASSVEALYNKDSLPNDGLFLGNGWYTLEAYGGDRFHWVNNDAEIVVTSPTGKRNQLRVSLESGPGLAGQPFELEVLDRTGQIVGRTNVQGRQTVNIALPIVAGQPAIFRLRVQGGGRPTPKDPRTLNFRVFELDWANK